MHKYMAYSATPTVLHLPLSWRKRCPLTVPSPQSTKSISAYTHMTRTIGNSRCVAFSPQSTRYDNYNYTSRLLGTPTTFTVTLRDIPHTGYRSPPTREAFWLVQRYHRYHQYRCQQHHLPSVTHVDTGIMHSRIVHTCGWLTRTRITIFHGTIPTWVARGYNNTVTRPNPPPPPDDRIPGLSRFKIQIPRRETNFTDEVLNDSHPPNPGDVLERSAKETPNTEDSTETTPTNRGTDRVMTVPRWPTTQPSTPPAVAYHFQPDTMVR